MDRARTYLICQDNRDAVVRRVKITYRVPPGQNRRKIQQNLIEEIPERA